MLFPLHLLELVPPPRAWSDVEKSQFKEGFTFHGGRWAAISKDFVITRNLMQVKGYARNWKTKHPEEYELLVRMHKERLDSPDDVIDPPLASISMSVSSESDDERPESDDEKPESKLPEVGGNVKRIRYE